MPWNIARLLRPFNNGRVCVLSRNIDMILLHLIPFSRKVPVVVIQGDLIGLLPLIDRSVCPIGHFRKALRFFRAVLPLDARLMNIVPKVMITFFTKQVVKYKTFTALLMNYFK